MKRIGMGIVGAGFVGPHHIDAVRRLGFVDVVAIAGSSDASAKAKADALGVPKAYGSYEALLNDPDVHVVHNATPNYLHYPVNAAAIAKGKHVVSDKPLAMTAAEAKKLLDQATKAGIVHAVTFTYRGNPLVQQARHAIARGDIGRPHFLVGHYLQDWLLKDTDYSWRLEPTRAAPRRRSATSAPTGAISRSTSAACGSLRSSATSRRSSRSARSRRARAKRSPPPARTSPSISSTSRSRTSRRSCCASTTARAAVFRSARVCAGHKNDLILEICGAKASIRWRQEHQNELWIGRRDTANEILQKDPGLIDAEVRGYAHLSGGHQESWADAFCNLMRDIYQFIADGKKPGDPHPPAFATFEDGYRANCIVEAILESAK